MERVRPRNLNVRLKKRTITLVCVAFLVTGLLLAVFLAGPIQIQNDRHTVGAATETLQVTNGNFESGVSDSWSDEDPAGYHDIPTSWSVTDWTEWISGSTLYPYSNVEYFDEGHGDVLYLDTPNTGATQTNIVLCSSSVSLPTNIYSIIVHIDTFKYDNGGLVTQVDVMVKKVGEETYYCDDFGSPSLDSTWHQYNFAVDQAAQGNSVEVILRVFCTDTGTTDAFVYLDNVYFTYELATIPGVVPDFEASVIGGEIHLTWGTPSDGGSPITSYSLYRSVDGGVYYLIGNFDDAIHEYDDDDVSYPPSYSYKIVANNAIGCSYPAYAGPIVIPEFSTLVVPVLGAMTMVLALVAIRRRMGQPDSNFKRR